MIYKTHGLDYINVSLVIQMICTTHGLDYINVSYVIQIICTTHGLDYINVSLVIQIIYTTHGLDYVRFISYLLQTAGDECWNINMVFIRQEISYASPRGFFHDDVIKGKHFPRYWPFVREFTGHWWIPLTKASDAELWCFLWSAPE